MCHLKCQLMLIGTELLLREAENKLKLWVFSRNGAIKFINAI